MSSLVNDLAAILQQISRPGDFYATGTIDIHAPRLEVDGVGAIALPLLPVQAAQILDVAERAPYGRGSETLVDTEVRRTWQVDAQHVRIGGKCWQLELNRIVDRVTRDLGIGGQVTAELYKLLVYDTGSFFVPHRDTEKAPGMFATLVIVLPSEYSGGELLIRHKDREARLDLCPSDPSEATFAAFYADCRHEVLPITAGHRLTLVYNLLRTGSGPLPQAPDYDEQRTQTTARLRAWSKSADDSDKGPDKLVYPLEHAYTQAELGFETLKGADAAVASLVTSAAEAASCDLHLALLTIEESGSAEYAGGGWSEDEDEYEIGEITESSETLHDWRRPDGSHSNMGPLTFFGDEVCPSDALDDAEDAEPDFEEATGNAGASFERFYQRAALVLWPRTKRANVIAEGCLFVSMPLLTELAERWEADGCKPEADIQHDALELAAQIRSHWPSDEWERKSASAAGHGRSLLGVLERLGDLDQRTAFLVEQAVAGAYGPEDNQALAKLFGQLQGERVSGLLAALIANNEPHRPDACAQLLRRCSEQPEISAGALYRPALALIEHLPDGNAPEDVPRFHASRYRQSQSPELVVDTLVAIERIDAALATRALEHVLAIPADYPMDATLLPAALSLRESLGEDEPPSCTTLRQAVLEHLGLRIDEPLEPPADWTRAAEVACSCAQCTNLNRFLRSPDEPQWRLKAVEAKRRHAEDSISRYRCDLDLTTDQRGRPYTLVCTKNQASYERLARQRRQDLEHRSLLGG